MREERKRARSEEASIADDKVALKHMEKEDWLPTAYLPFNGKRIKLNVGGQRFEVAEKVLLADPDSLLAALCGGDCPLDVRERVRCRRYRRHHHYSRRRLCRI